MTNIPQTDSNLSTLSHTPAIMPPSLTAVAIAETCANIVERVIKTPAYDRRAISFKDIEELSHTMRCVPDTDAEASLMRLCRAAKDWRRHYGSVDTTDPCEWDPIMQQEFTDIEELKAAVDSFVSLAEIGGAA